MLNFKNKTERESFILNYENWTDSSGKLLGVWKEIPEVGLKFYRYDFATGAVLIVTEYEEYGTVFDGSYSAEAKKELTTRHKFCLILQENDSYANHYRTYTLDGCNLWAVTDYMTKNKLLL